MDELWIVSVPWREKTAEEAYQELVRNLNAYATCTKFSIPDMKVRAQCSIVLYQRFNSRRFLLVLEMFSTLYSNKTYPGRVFMTF